MLVGCNRTIHFSPNGIQTLPPVCGYLLDLLGINPRTHILSIKAKPHTFTNFR